MTGQLVPAPPSDAPPAPLAAPGTAPAAPAAGPSTAPGDRRVLRAVARWGAAVVLCAGLGAGAAAWVTSQDRDDVPGLATASDGRWDYPELKLPALHSGEPRPGNEANAAGRHYADPRDLLLPAPAGARADKDLPGGLVPEKRFLAEYPAKARGRIATALKDHAVRQVVARGWTMPDGTHSRVYLLRFNSAGLAGGFVEGRLGASSTPGQEPVESDYSDMDEGWSLPDGWDLTGNFHVYAEVEPYGKKQVRHAYAECGDTVALVIQDRAGALPAVPFHQTLILQTQLLQ